MMPSSPKRHPVLDDVAEKLGEAHLDRPFHLYAQFRTREGSSAALVQAIADAKATSGDEPGNMRYELLAQPDDPNAFVMSEHWESFADFVTHVELPHITQMLGALGDLLAEPPVNQVLIPPSVR